MIGFLDRYNQKHHHLASITSLVSMPIYDAPAWPTLENAKVTHPACMKCAPGAVTCACKFTMIHHVPKYPSVTAALLTHVMTMMYCSDLTFGVKQLVDRDRPIAWRERLEAAYDYLENIVAKDELLSKYSFDKCKNLNDHCTFWALKGRCETHRGYMKLNCAPVCHTCDQLAEETRCPLDRDAMPDVWTPGDLNAFFTNLTTLDEYQQYSPQVLSRPEYADGDTNEMANYILGPWITVLDNVITQEEANRIVELGHELGFRRSAIADGTYEGHVYDGRTSSNTWCFYDCFNDTLVQNATFRIEEITNIPSTNSEYWQLLEYKEGQFYHNHHDYSSVYKERQQGVRILTVFLYLNDVEEGGGTHFSSLNITVQPKSGRALVWPSVLNDDPSEMDPRTFHQALPVTRGVKYGANAWIHLRDFKTPLHKGCIPN